MKEILPLGEHAWLIRFREETAAASWVEEARLANWPGVKEILLAYQTAAVFGDPESDEFDALEERIRALVIPHRAEIGSGRFWEIPVLYDGPDLHVVAETCGLTVREVVACHSGSEYRVFAIGFLPGFPYVGYLTPPLDRMPRRTSPRPRVPAGSVAIAGRQAGIYPQDSPGGWHLLGRTPVPIVDLERAYFPIRAGDRLRFRPIDSGEFAMLASGRPTL